MTQTGDPYRTARQGRCNAPEVIQEWYEALLHENMPPVIEKWRRKLNVDVIRLLLPAHEDQMGTLQLPRGHIRLNTKLVKRPKDFLEEVIVHVALLQEPAHSDRFVAILDKHDPTWEEARAELNGLPLAGRQKKRAAWKRRESVNLLPGGAALQVFHPEVVS